jgi:hypothetical protein
MRTLLTTTRDEVGLPDFITGLEDTAHLLDNAIYDGDTDKLPGLVLTALRNIHDALATLEDMNGDLQTQDEPPSSTC